MKTKKPRSVPTQTVALDFTQMTGEGREQPGAWGEDLKQLVKERFEVVKEHLEAVKAKLEPVPNAPSAESLLDLPFLLRAELIERGIEVAESSAELSRRLAHDLLRDDDRAYAVAWALTKKSLAEEELTRVVTEELQRAANVTGIDMTDFDRGVPFSPDGFPSYERFLLESDAYLKAVGRVVVFQGEVLGAFSTWRSGKDQRLQELAPVVRPFPQDDKATQTEDAELLAQLPNGQADQDLTRSLMLHPRGWFKNEQLANCYHEGKNGHTVVYQPSEVEIALGDAPQLALEALDRRFLELKSEILADVIDILFYHWNTHKDDQVGSVLINAAKLCEYRGKTLGGDNLELHWHALRDAFSLTLRDKKSDINAKVFNFDSKGENQDGPGARYAYRPGIFLEYALRGEPLYFAPFLQKVWALDPVRHNEAKRLARYLRGDWRMNTQAYLTAENGGPRAARWHSWTFLLAEAGIDVEPHRKGKDPKRLIGTIARAVETLYQMEVIAEGGFDIYHPDDRKRAENLPPRGALDVWLALRVCLAPSAKLREALLETDGKRRAGRTRDAKALATERAKKQLRTQGKPKPKRQI